MWFPLSWSYVWFTVGFDHLINLLSVVCVALTLCAVCLCGALISKFRNIGRQRGEEHQKKTRNKASRSLIGVVCQTVGP